jgi:hypothetical protein
MTDHHDLTLHLALSATGGTPLWRALSGPPMASAGVLAPGRLQSGGTPVRLAGTWLGGAELGPSDAGRFRAEAQAVVAERLAALGASRARVVLDVRRQDRLMEHAHLGLVRSGAVCSFTEQFSRPQTPALDWGELAERIAAVSGVAEVVVRPVELFAEWPGQLAAHLLRLAGISGIQPGPAVAPANYTDRGLLVARAMNAHVVSDAERALVAEFVASLFPGPETGNLFLDEQLRAEVLVGYAEVNSKMFRKWLPELPEDAYLDDDRTAALATRKNQESRP